MSNELTPEQLAKAKMLLDMMTGDPEELRALLEGLSAVSRESDGLVQISQHSATLLRDIEHAQRWQRNWTEISGIMRMIGAGVRNIVVIGAALAMLATAARWAIGTFGPSDYGPPP